MAGLESLGFYKNLFDHLPIAIFVADASNGMIVDVNDEASKLIGFSSEELIGIHQSKLHPPIEEQINKISFKEHVKLLLSGQKIDPIEHDVIDSNNNIIPVEISPTLIELNNKKLIVAIFKDLRDIKSRENILTYYDKALEKSSIYLALVDKNYTYLTVNESYAKTFNLNKEDIVGSHIYDLFGKEYFLEIIKDKFDRALLGESIEYEASVDLMNKKKYLQVHYEPYYSNNDKNIIGVVVSLYDLTKYKKYEEENLKKEKLLIQQSKMAAMGEMLENIAHQWRQPLSLISTCTSGIMLQRDFNTLTDEILDDSLNNIMNTTSYLSNTIDDFKSFFERDKQSYNFNIKDNVNKTLELLDVGFSSNDIELIKDFNNDEIIVHSYKNELMQVLLNIFNNAKDALLSNEEFETRKLIKVSVFKKNDRVHIEILDSAGGIPLDIIEKIFEPYFTTKHQSQGTGIGLFMTREIVTKHLEGTIFVENHTYLYDNTEYTGALFKIII